MDVIMLEVWKAGISFFEIFTSFLASYFAMPNNLLRGTLGGGYYKSQIV